MNPIDVGGDQQAGLGQAIAVLRDLLAQLETAGPGPAPWQSRRPARPITGRLSATDQLSWWFRPASAETDADAWDTYFDDLDAGPPAPRREPDAAPAGPASSRYALREVLAEPEEELIDADADAVVTCLYDFVHALGRNDVEAAVECVADDYHTVEDDREIDRDGLARQLRVLLDSLHGWEKDISLVEVPQPVLHPAGVLVHVELQIEARHPASGRRRARVDRRIAVFARRAGSERAGSERAGSEWRIRSLSRI